MVSNVAQVIYSALAVGGLIAGKSNRAVLAGVDAVQRGASGIANMAGQKSEVVSNARETDSLVKRGTDLRSAVKFNELPIFPGASEPERYVILMPVIWNDRNVFPGRSREIPVEDLYNENTLYHPDFDSARLEGPGIYRVGYKLSSVLDQRRASYGGGPILHVFSDDNWNYLKILEDFEASDFGDQFRLAPASPKNPERDVELLARYDSSPDQAG